jgi:hypothetical protein
MTIGRKNDIMAEVGRFELSEEKSRRLRSNKLFY